MTKVLMLLALCAAAFTPSFEDAVKDFSTGNHKFSSDLFKELINGNNKDLVLCPFSAETVLSMTTDGAKGLTADEIVNAVDLPKKTDDRRNAFKSILPRLEKSSPAFQLSIANRIYVSQRYELKCSYEDTLESVYQSDVKNINFFNRQQAADTINKWVESKTNDKIKDLINPDSLSESTTMVLVNAIYLKGKWNTPFDPHRTVKEPFYGWDGNSPVYMMHSKDLSEYNYFHCGYLRAKFLEVLFNDSHVSMTFVLPDDQDSYSDLENDIEPFLTPHNYRKQLVAVAIPRFSTTSAFQLDSVLRKLGVKRAFSPASADFSGISDEHNLHIDTVVTKTYINVTETGTEAAGATAVGLSPTAVIRPPPADFIANHPFAYYIRDDDSGSILFVGRFTNNSK